MVNDLVTIRGGGPIALFTAQRRKLIIAAALIAAPLTIAGFEIVAPGSVFGGGSRVASSLASALGNGRSDLLAMLRMRSPGERSQGELADTKARKTVPNTVVPHERALAKVRPPVASGGFPAPPPSGPEFAEALPPGLLVASGLGPAIGPGLTHYFQPPVGGPLLPGVIPGGGVPVVTPEITPVVSGVPEPDTWALMIIGLGGIGASLRRKNRQRLSTRPLKTVTGRQ